MRDRKLHSIWTMAPAGMRGLAAGILTCALIAAAAGHPATKRSTTA